MESGSRRSGAIDIFKEFKVKKPINKKQVKPFAVRMMVFPREKNKQD
jgi:hypothetical protein